MRGFCRASEAPAEVRRCSSGSEAAADLSDGPISIRPSVHKEGPKAMAGSPDAASASATRAPQRLAVLPMAFALRPPPLPSPASGERRGWGTIIMKDHRNV